MTRDTRGTEVFLIVLLFMFLLTAYTVFKILPQRAVNVDVNQPAPIETPVQ